jgi:hypothetical protein
VTGVKACDSRQKSAISLSGLPKDSVVNVTALVTLNKADLDPRPGTFRQP